MIQVVSNSTETLESVYSKSLSTTELIRFLYKLSYATADSSDSDDTFSPVVFKIFKHLPLSLQVCFLVSDEKGKNPLLNSLVKAVNSHGFISFIEDTPTYDFEVNLNSIEFFYLKESLSRNPGQFSHILFQNAYFRRYDEILLFHQFQTLKIDLSEIRQFQNVLYKVTGVFLKSKTDLRDIDLCPRSRIKEIDLESSLVHDKEVQNFLSSLDNIQKLNYKDWYYNAQNRHEVAFCPNNGVTDFELLFSNQVNSDMLRPFGLENISKMHINLGDSDHASLDVEEIIPKLNRLNTLTINAMMSPSYFSLTFNCESANLQYLNITRSNLQRCDFSELYALKELVLLDCVIDSATLDTMKNSRNLSTLIVINGEILWSNFWQIPTQLTKLALLSNDHNSYKDLIFFGNSSNKRADEYAQLLNLNINSVSFGLQYRAGDLISVCKIGQNKIKFPKSVGPEQAEITFIPNFNSIDFDFLDFDEAGLSELKINLYSFGNIFHKPKNVPSGIECQYAYSNLNMLERETIKDVKLKTVLDSNEGIFDYDSDDVHSRGNLSIDMDYSESDSEYKYSRRRTRNKGRSNRKLADESNLTDDDNNLNDSEEEAKRKSKLIKSVISSKNIKASSNPEDPDKPFECEFCPRAFKRKEHLRRHSLTHTNYRPHVCTNCGRGFRRSDNLKNHERRCLSSGKAGGTGYKLREDPNRLDSEEIERVKKMELQKRARLKRLKDMGKSIKLAEFYESNKSHTSSQFQNERLHPTSHLNKLPDFEDEIGSDSDVDEEEEDDGDNADDDAYEDKIFDRRRERSHMISRYGNSPAESGLETPPTSASGWPTAPTSPNVSSKRSSLNTVPALRLKRGDFNMSPNPSVDRHDVATTVHNETKMRSTGKHRLDEKENHDSIDAEVDDEDDDVDFSSAPSTAAKSSIKHQVNEMFTKCELLPNNVYKCAKCSQLFTKRGNLRRHLVIHFNLKPYTCDCGKSFKRSDNFKKHTSRCKVLINKRQKTDNLGNAQSHTFSSGEVGYKMDIVKEEQTGDEMVNSLSPGHSSRSPSVQLSSRLVKQTELSDDSGIEGEEKKKGDDRQFECNFCQKKFKRKYHLNRHLIVHQNDNLRPYNCPQCNNSFKRGDLLEKHILNNKCKTITFKD